MLPFLWLKYRPMNQKKLSSRVYSLAKSAAAGAALPVFFIYIMVAKPDYRLMNAAAHVVLPVANVVGDAITWPVRATGNLVRNIHDLANLRTENAELQAQLDVALAAARAGDIAVRENQMLGRELDIMRSQPYATVIANIRFDNSVMHNNTFMISKGAKSGIEPGMVVTTFDGAMVGIVIDAAPNYSRVRTLLDGDTNIAVRVVGSEVYGFLAGNGTRRPTMGFFSDPEFQSTSGIKLVTSAIGGVLPDGIIVGEMINDSEVRVTPPTRDARVMVLKFDETGSYK